MSQSVKPVRSGKPADEIGDPKTLFDRRFNTRFEDLSPTVKKVVTHIDANRLAVLSTSAADLGAAVGASDATVIRAVRALGFDGLADLRQAVAASLEAPSGPLENLRLTNAEVGQGAEAAISAVLETHREAMRDLDDPGVKETLARAVGVLNAVQKVFVFGIGPSAALSEYVAFLLNRHGRKGRALNATGNGLADQLLELQPGDGLLALAYGQTYAEIVVVFEEAKRLRLPIVLVTDSLEPKLASQADVVVPARRGRQERIALHGVTLIVLEAIVLGLALSRPEDALKSLVKMGSLRQRLSR